MAAVKLGSTHMTELLDLPHHLIFGKILQLPTKAAVQLSFILSKQFWNEDVVSSSVPVLDFDEDDDFARHNRIYDADYLHQHKKFVKFLEWYLEYYREKSHLPLDKLRLNMKMYSSTEDAKTLDQWLELALEKGVKELDISGPELEESGVRPPSDKSIWYLNWMTTFANAKYLTSLKLEGVKLSSFPAIAARLKFDGLKAPLLLPSLKTLSLKTLRFEDNDHALYYLLLTCPALEFLSLTDVQCTLYIPANIQSLELHCETSEYIICHELLRDIIQSLKYVGVPSRQQPPIPISWQALFKTFAGKSLTYLNLQSVKIIDFQLLKRIFPSLKTIFFTNIQELDYRNLLTVLLECPSLEYLSLMECSFGNDECHVSSSSLKSLEIEDCSRLRLLQVDEAENLESFKFLSMPSNCEEVTLNNSFNLKNINICVDDLEELSINGHRYMLNSLDSSHTIASLAQIKIDIVLRSRHKRRHGGRISSMFNCFCVCICLYSYFCYWL